MRQMCRQDSVLVLGAGGRVGTLLRRYWAQSPPQRIRPFFQGGRAGAIRGSERLFPWRAGDDPAQLPAVETVVALWGVTPASVSAPARAAASAGFDLNPDLGRSALEIAAAIGARRVLLASSAAVYTGSASGRHREADVLPEPASAYGRSKLAMERIAWRWIGAQPAPPRLVILRLGNVIGADMLFGRLARDRVVCLDRFASGAGPVRSYLAVEDLARLVETVACKDVAALPRVLNVAGDKALAMADLAELAGRTVTWRAAPPGALERLELDTSRLASLIGDRPASSEPARAIASWKNLRLAA